VLRINLSEEERNQLRQARSTRDSNLSERCLYVLLSDEGKGVGEIAKQTKRNKHTVRFWLKVYQKGGIERLKGTSPPGRPARKAPRIYPIILQIVPKSPTEYGYQEEGWTVNMIVDYLKRQGIDASPSTVKRVLKKTDGSTKDFLKQFQHMPQVIVRKDLE